MTGRDEELLEKRTLMQSYSLLLIIDLHEIVDPPALEKARGLYCLNIEKQSTC